MTSATSRSIDGVIFDLFPGREALGDRSVILMTGRGDEAAAEPAGGSPASASIRR